MAKAIHMMVRVLDLDKSITFYQTAFGLDVADRFDFDGFTLVYLRNPEIDFEVELTWNEGRTKPYQHGDAYGHIAFAVDDLDAEHARFKAAGFEPAEYQGVLPGRQPDGAVLLRSGSGWLQDRDVAAPWALSVERGGLGPIIRPMPTLAGHVKLTGRGRCDDDPYHP